MPDLNHVTLIGRLTRDAETPTGNGPTRISIAVNRRVKHGDQWSDEASFFEVTYWHKTILPYLTKGKQIAVEGELVQDRWTDGEGAKRSAVKINAINIQLLGGGQGEAQQGQSAGRYGNGKANATSARSSTATANQEAFGDDSFSDEEQIPF